MATETSAASVAFLTAITAKGSRAKTEKNYEEAQEEENQHTQSLMYAARMKYLDDANQIKPDSLFMTRKQAQKDAQNHDLATSLKKLDVGGTQARKANAANIAAASSILVAKKSRAFMDTRNQSWQHKFQAGCHFWQCIETGECRVEPPANAQLLDRSTVIKDAKDDHDDDDDDPPFPSSFDFLYKA